MSREGGNSPASYEPDSYVTRPASAHETWGHYVSGALTADDAQPGVGDFITGEEDPIAGVGGYVDVESSSQ